MAAKPNNRAADTHVQSHSTPRCAPSMTAIKDIMRRSRNLIGHSKVSTQTPPERDDLEFLYDSGDEEASAQSYDCATSHPLATHHIPSISSRYSVMQAPDPSSYIALQPTGLHRVSTNSSLHRSSINWVAAVPPEDRVSNNMRRASILSGEATHLGKGSKRRSSHTGYEHKDFLPSRRPSRSPTILPSDFVDVADGMQTFNLSPLLAYVVGRESETSWGPKFQNRSFFMNAWHSAPIINLQYDFSQGLAAMVFSPTCRIMILWDLVLLCGVSWTLVFTPLEIAFPWEGAPDGDGSNSVVHFLNICVNVIFVLDILVQFNLAYDERSANGSRSVTNRYLIACKYVRGRLLVDILCAFPFWHMLNYSSLVTTPLATMKLFRLLRIMRLMRGNFIITRPIMPYWMKTCVKLAAMTFFAAHVFSCTWAALATLNPDQHTWLDRLASEKVGIDDSSSRSMLRVYLWSLYFSITLITTVGFGDVTPQNDIECLVAMLGVTCGSVIWAYILSCLFSVLAQMDPHRIQFESMMDELWYMTSDHSIPGPLLYDVQQYFSECEDIWKLARRRSDLMSRMSPNLRGRMSLALCAEWIGKISYIREMFLLGIPATTGFLADIACKLEAKVFSPGEKLENALYIVRKGLIGQGCRVYGVGDVCGEDFMVQNPQNRINFVPLALTMVGTLTLSCQDFDETLRRFPEHAKVVRYHMNWLAVKYGIGRILRSMSSKDPSTPKSPGSSMIFGICR